MFGYRVSAMIAKCGMLRICAFGESVCKFCSGKFSNTFPENSTGPICYGVSHVFATCISKEYVDDIMLPVDCKETFHSLVEYATELLQLFSYRFKDTDINFQPLRTSTSTIEEIK